MGGRDWANEFKTGDVVRVGGFFGTVAEIIHGRGSSMVRIEFENGQIYGYQNHLSIEKVSISPLQETAFSEEEMETAIEIINAD